MIELKRALARRREALLDVLIGILAVTPLFLTAHIPLFDLPNHLARQYVFAELPASRILQSFYYVKLELVPNLALEMFVFLARQAMSIDAAMRLFCIATIGLLFGGTRLVSLALAGPQARLYRFAPFLCYGGPFQFGFLSFCFGVGLALIFFALYLRLRDRRAWHLVVILVPCGILLLLCHLAAFGIWALAIVGYELAQPGDITARANVLAVARRSLRVAAFLLPPLAALILFGANSERNTTEFANIRQKLEGLAAITLFSNPVFEFALWGLAAAGLAFALYTRTLRITRTGMAMMGVMGLVFLLLPRTAAGSGYIDYRVPWAASFFFLAALLPGEHRPQIQKPLHLFFSVFLAARLAGIAFLWLRWEPVIAGMVSVLKTLPPGARLAVVEGKAHSSYEMRDPALTHLAAYAVAYRHAFEPCLFASITGQILHFQPAYLARQVQDNPDTLDRLDPVYTHVLVLRPQSARIAAGLPLRCMAHGASFALFAVGESSTPAEMTRCQMRPGAAARAR